MEQNLTQITNLNISSSDYDSLFKKYIIKKQILYYSRDDLLNREDNEDYLCSICLDVLKDPISCSSNKISHSFCKKCIDNYLKNNKKCPICKLPFQYQIKNEIIDELNGLTFKCSFTSQGCNNNTIFYPAYLNHINNCIYNNFLCECAIKKYNYKQKKFEKCGYKSNKINIDEHFKNCGFKTYKCIICDKKFFLINLEDHVTNECIFGIINYQNGDIYILEEDIII